MAEFCFCAGVALVAACLAGTLTYFMAWHRGYRCGWEVARDWPADLGGGQELVHGQD